MQLYARYIQSNPTKRQKVIGDYALQLTYAGRSYEAIPFFHEFLKNNPPLSKKYEAMLGLALAYRWSGQPELAQEIYKRLMMRYPNQDYILEEKAYAFVDEARGAAYTNDPKKAVILYEKAIDLAPHKSEEWLLEYAEQLNYSDDPAKAIFFFLKFLQTVPSEEDEIKARLGLALAYRRNNQSKLAKQIYDNLTSVKDQREVDAREEVEAKIELARHYAKTGRNPESALLFEQIILHDPQQRIELLREWADQVTAAGRASDAVPLYLEHLNQNLSESEEIKTRLGLATALRWSGNWKQAHIEYKRLLRDYPEKAQVEKGWVDNLIEQARHAARHDQNERSEELFSQLVQTVPERRKEFLLEWADQLNYSGDPAKAIRIFTEVLEYETDQEKRIQAYLGRALAYRWNKQRAKSKQEYEILVDRFPTHPRVKDQWTSALIDEARHAAYTSQNKESEMLFRKVILDAAPERRGELIREWADQLNYSDQSEKAIPIYREALQNAKNEEEEILILEGLALAYAWTDRIDEALLQYERILQAVSDNPDVVEEQKAVLIKAARLLADNHENAAAAQVYGQIIESHPETRNKLLREYADQLTFSNQAAKAVPLYDEYLAIPPSEEEIKQARYGLALALNWSNQKCRSIKVYCELVKEDPDDIRALLGEASVFISIDELSKAKKDLRHILKLEPKNVEGATKLGRALSFQNKQRDAQRILRQVICEHPENADANFYLAQAQFWMGRPNEALCSLERLFEYHPEHFEGLALQREIIHFGMARSRNEGTEAKQSDKLDIKSGYVEHSVSPNNNQTRFGTRYRRFQYDPDQIDEDVITVDRPSFFARHRINDNWEWFGRLGADYSHSKMPFKRHESFIWDTNLTYWYNDVFRFDAGTSRVTFDNIDSLSDGLWATYANVGLQITPNEQVRLTGIGNWGVYTDSNRRLWGMAEAEFRVFKKPHINFGTRTILFTFKKLVFPPAGYFNPHMYRSHVGFVHAFGKIKKSTYWDFYGSIGMEHARPQGNKRIFDCGGSVTFVINPQVEVRPFYHYFSSATDTGFARGTAGISIDWIWDPGYKRLVKTEEPDILDGPVPLLDYVRRSQGDLDTRSISPVPGSSLGDR